MQTQKVSAVSPNLVISQFQAGGTSSANDEFVEIHNIGSEPVDLKDYKLVYRSSSGISDVGPIASWTTSSILQPGQFYLVASSSYTGSVGPDYVYDPAVCRCSLSANAGGLALKLVKDNSEFVIDAVGWGSATNIYFEGTRTSAPTNSASKARDENGCKDTDNNQADFINLNPSAPRNSSTPAAACTGGGTTLFGTLSANPNTVSPGQNILLKVLVTPATTPPSTGISVTGNLSSLGLPATQTFYDDGTNGDTTAGDNVFSYIATVPVNISNGDRTLSATVADAQSRSITTSTVITVSAPDPNEDPLVLGNPSGATPDINNENNYLMQKPQYTLSYNRSKGTPNWVGWRLASNWLGSTSRQDNYRPDTSLPVGWYQVTSEDYTGSGYDRGHMCPSADRTNSVADNSATFLMTNFVPQYGPNNQGPWEDLESYCRTLANQGNELYIFSGPL
ncbi:MAG TPA: DNA/RNA non-specific endonuclease, partial [Pyrinomonadaceae bacterium]|nr:DNA/RNA non-specific endonuclease [Pyrinomonadaceae bacterium]